MNQPPPEDNWRVRLVGSHLPWGRKPDRPAVLGDELCAAMLARENILEDANYQKIIPNQFVVEVGQENYARNFRLIEGQIIRQWNEKLLVNLLTANSRQGRQEYRFAGPLKIEIHPVTDLGIDQARIYCRVQMGKEPAGQTAIQKALTACLEILASGRRTPLHAGVVTIGRDSRCDIYLAEPAVQQHKLVSSQHAYLMCNAVSYRLFDGTQNGKASLNGTYVNAQRLTAAGAELKNGDLIQLAALDPAHPDPNSPGVASLRFFLDCK